MENKQLVTDIKEIAESLIGFREKPKNSGFYEFPSAFQDLMNKKMGYPIVQEPTSFFEMLGWAKGQAWCVFLCKMVWELGYVNYDSAMINELGRLFDPSATKTLRNFIDAGYTHSYTPSIGAIAFWQIPGDWRGHAGITTDILLPDLSEFATVDGNTAKRGEREGQWVLKKNNTMGMRGNMVFKGFIKPKMI